MANREQRRKLPKQQRVPSSESFHQELRAERKKTADFVVQAYTAAMLMVLRDKFGFGHERASKALWAVQQAFDSVQTGHVSVDDWWDIIEAELQIKRSSLCE